MLQTRQKVRDWSPIILSFSFPQTRQHRFGSNLQFHNLSTLRLDWVSCFKSQALLKQTTQLKSLTLNKCSGKTVLANMRTLQFEVWNIGGSPLSHSSALSECIAVRRSALSRHFFSFPFSFGSIHSFQWGVGEGDPCEYLWLDHFPRSSLLPRRPSKS